ncbi:TPA: hypothetical protein ACNIQM_000761 [Citrobacter werkmanii]
MKTKLLFLSIVLFSFSAIAANQKELANEFNGYASININSGNQPAYISLKCGFVSEELFFTADDSGKVNLTMQVNSDQTGVVNYKSNNIYGEKMPDGELDGKAIGWEYYFDAPRGQIVVSILNSGVTYTEVKVLHGDGYRTTKSKCKIENVIKSS